MILKVILRNLIKRPFLNLVKVLGLSLSLCGIIFISLFLKNELSYDRFHQQSDQIYRFTITSPNFLGGKHFARINNPWYLKNLKDKLPEIEQYTMLSRLRGGIILHNNIYYNISQGFGCDNTFFSVFDAELLVGDKNTLLNEPGNMIISESYAKKIFGDKDPMGEKMTIPSGQFYGESYHFTIKGIMKDFPSNSHFHPEFLTSPLSFHDQGWGWVYLVLTPNADLESIRQAFKLELAERNEVDVDEIRAEAHLQKLTDIHLNSNKLREVEPNGNMTNIYVLAIAALVLLLISMSNYMNLNLGMAGFSYKFLFINKLLGSDKKATSQFFLVEGISIIVLTLLFSLVISLITNTYIIQHFDINLIHANWGFISTIILIFCMLTIIFGLIPSLKPAFRHLVNQLNNESGNKNRNGVGSKSLIVIQYAFSIALIVAVFVISRQNNFALKSGMGAQHNNVMVFESVHATVQQKFELFKSKLLEYPSIEHVSSMMEPPGGEANDMFEFEMEDYEKTTDEDQFDRIGIFPCDYSFASLFDLQFLSGQNFRETNIDNEGSGEYIINEAAMHRLHYNNPDEIVGKEFKLNFSYAPIKIPKGRIVGVVKDFHLSSVKKKIEPLVMFKRDKLWLINFVVSYKPGMHEQAINDMLTVWQTLFPQYPFKYENVESLYQQVYKSELLQARLLTIFTFIALFICSMGLLGIALILTQQRTKEIGIRKVNGASLIEILIDLNKDFVIWVIVALVIATPASWYAMHLWLKNFAYRTALSWWIFAIAGIVALIIALITVSWHSWQAAKRNPVEALRYE